MQKIYYFTTPSQTRVPRNTVCNIQWHASTPNKLVSLRQEHGSHSPSKQLVFFVQVLGVCIDLPVDGLVTNPIISVVLQERSKTLPVLVQYLPLAHS